MQHFNHTASLMEAAILKNMPETRSEDSMLFRKISRFELSKWPVLRFCKITAFQKHTELRMLIMNSPGRIIAFVSFLAHSTLSGGVTVFFYIWVQWHHKHTHIWKHTQFWNILPNIGMYPKMEDLTSFPDWICSAQAGHIEYEVTPTHANMQIFQSGGCGLCGILSEESDICGSCQGN